jgi:hypothetical protein
MRRHRLRHSPLRFLAVAVPYIAAATTGPQRRKSLSRWRFLDLARVLLLLPDGWSRGLLLRSEVQVASRRTIRGSA